MWQPQPNLTFVSQLFKMRLKTKSLNFYDDEIIAILPDGSIYLKEGVRRKHYPNEVTIVDDSEFINSDAIFQSKVDYANSIIKEGREE